MRKNIFKNHILISINLAMIFEVKKGEFRAKVQGKRGVGRQSTNTSSLANSCTISCQYCSY